MLKMTLKTLSGSKAAALDEELMGAFAFSIDQLMELAGLSVSQAVFAVHPPSKGAKVLVVCGPGNNGGDGLVAARHLFHYGYKPVVHYPKQSNKDIYQRLSSQLKTLEIPFTDDFHNSLDETDTVVDAIFGFSFQGEVRQPFPAIISALEKTTKTVISVDAPSSWNIENGPPKEGPGSRFQPEALISLTAAKPLVRFYKGRHFIGGRFLPPSLAEKYDLTQPPYEGIDQIVEVNERGEKL